jgi:alkylated DNA repair dioxygenase AlkB
VKISIDNGSLEYIPAFLSPQNSALLFEHLSAETPWNQGMITIFGKKIATPRLEAFYAENGLKYTYSGQQLTVHSFTKELESLKNQLEQFTDQKFNSVLINLYRNGSDSNGWHADNEKELGINPFIASITLGTERRFDIQHIKSKEKKSLILENGSLLLMGGEMQHYWKHQIAKTKKVHSPRINLTFRLIK